MNYEFGELFEFLISIKVCENTNKVGLTHLFQAASPCFPVFPTFWNVASALESDFTAQMVWCGTAQLHFAVKHASLLFDDSLYFPDICCSAKMSIAKVMVMFYCFI